MGYAFLVLWSIVDRGFFLMKHQANPHKRKVTQGAIEYCLSHKGRAQVINAVQKNAFLTRLNRDGFMRRKAEAACLLKTHRALQQKAKDPKALFKAVKQKMLETQAFLRALHKKLIPYEVRTKGTTAQIKTQKMAEGLQIALGLTLQDFELILKGQLPSGYAYAPPEYNFFGDTDHIYASGRGLALKLLLWHALSIVDGYKKVSDCALLGDLDAMPFVHITPLPDDFDMVGLKQSPFFFSDAKTPLGLFAFHNGYAFGGQRDETRYDTVQPLGPFDCSSFIAYVVACKKSFDTQQEALLYQEKEGFFFKKWAPPSIAKAWTEEILPEWKVDPFHDPMHEVLETCVLSCNTKATAGLVSVERFYKDVNKEPCVALEGTGGHTGFLVCTFVLKGENYAVTLGFNRDIEDASRLYPGGGRDGGYAFEVRLLTPDLIQDQHIVFFLKQKND